MRGLDSEAMVRIRQEGSFLLNLENWSIYNNYDVAKYMPVLLYLKFRRYCTKVPRQWAHASEQWATQPYIAGRPTLSVREEVDSPVRWGDAMAQIIVLPKMLQHDMFPDRCGCLQPNANQCVNN